MKILTRYIYKELISSFFVGMLVFTFILFMNSIFQLIDLLVTKKVSLVIISELTLYIILTLFTFTVPISIFFAVIFTYSKLSESNEITALRSAGIPVVHYIWQPLLASILLTVILCWINLYSIPKTQGQFMKIYNAIIQKQPLSRFEEKTFVELGDYKIYVDRVNNKTNDLSGINIYKLGAENKLIIAKKGKATFDTSKGLIFTLNDGIIETASSIEPDRLTRFSFVDYKITIPVNDEKQIKQARTIREFTGNELLTEIENYKKQNLSFSHLKIEYILRWVISFSAFCLVLVGLPMGIMTRQTGRSLGMGLSIVIIGIYYFLLMLGITLAEKQVFSADYILWLSNVVMLAGGLMLNYRVIKT